MVLSEFGQESPMILVVDFGANEICHNVGEKSADAINPKMIARHDDTKKCDCGVDQKRKTHP
jgi:hypothetical protein